VCAKESLPRQRRLVACGVVRVNTTSNITAALSVSALRDVLTTSSAEGLQPLSLSRRRSSRRMSARFICGCV
jgi:hypothetical protein